MTCECATSAFTSFDGIRFEILADPQSGVYRDWDGMEPIYAEEQVPYSNIVVRELIGFTPAVVTWRLQIPCRHRYNDLLARIGYVGELVVLANYQSLTGTQTTLGNPAQVYEVLDNVLLRAMPTREHHVDGYREVECVFERAFDPVSRLATVEP
jgi:hypothetical protein